MWLRFFIPTFALLFFSVLIVWEQNPQISFDQYSEARELAQSLCKSTMAEQPKVEFSTDGCTLWPDKFSESSTWGNCCIRHDVEYWCGGTAEERVTSDNAFRECVKKKNGMMAGVMYWSSRLFGHPMLPTSWRWGWGHGDYPRGYNAPTALSKSEKATTTPPQ